MPSKNCCLFTCLLSTVGIAFSLLLNVTFVRSLVQRTVLSVQIQSFTTLAKTAQLQN